MYLAVLIEYNPIDLSLASNKLQKKLFCHHAFLLGPLNYHHIKIFHEILRGSNNKCIYMQMSCRHFVELFSTIPQQ